MLIDYDKESEESFVEDPIWSEDRSTENHNPHARSDQSGYAIVQKQNIEKQTDNGLLKSETYKAQTIKVVETNTEDKNRAKFIVIAYVPSLDSFVPDNSSIEEIEKKYFTVLGKFSPKNKDVIKPSPGQFIRVSFSNPEYRLNPVYEGPLEEFNLERTLEAEQGDKELKDIYNDIDESVNKAINDYRDYRNKNKTEIGGTNSLNVKGNGFLGNYAERAAKRKKEDIVGSKDVVETANIFREGPYGERTSGYGTPIDIYFKSEYISAKAQKITPFGFTWTVMFLSAKKRNLLQNISAKSIKNSLEAWIRGGVYSNISVLQNLGIGSRVDFSQSSPGDFIQFELLQNPKKIHSGIFLEWIKKDQTKIGFKFRSCSKEANGISNYESYFEDLGNPELKVDYSTISVSRLR